MTNFGITLTLAFYNPKLSAVLLRLFTVVLLGGTCFFFLISLEKRSLFSPSAGGNKRGKTFLFGKIRKKTFPRTQTGIEELEGVWMDDSSTEGGEIEDSHHAQRPPPPLALSAMSSSFLPSSGAMVATPSNASHVTKGISTEVYAQSFHHQRGDDNVTPRLENRTSTSCRRQKSRFIIGNGLDDTLSGGDSAAYQRVNGFVVSVIACIHGLSYVLMMSVDLFMRYTGSFEEISQNRAFVLCLLDSFLGMGYLACASGALYRHSLPLVLCIFIIASARCIVELEELSESMSTCAGLLVLAAFTLVFSYRLERLSRREYLFVEERRKNRDAIRNESQVCLALILNVLPFRVFNRLKSSEEILQEEYPSPLLCLPGVWGWRIWHR